MHKIVFNNCYGGFSLSLEAVHWLADHATDSDLKNYIQLSYRDTHERYLGHVIGDWFDDRRHHRDLVAVVEALGAKANGDCANLAIACISGNQYRIEVYDGAEEVVTPTDSDWIFIKEGE